MKSVTSIFFMRHGEVYNPKGILYGRLPRFGLSRQGREIVRKTAFELKSEKIEEIYTSPMLRARQTAQIAGSILHKNIRISQMLNEVRIIFQGMPLSEYRQEIQPKLYNKELVAQGQETIEEIAKRMMQFLHKIHYRHKNGKILAISHGDPILILVAVTQKLPFTWAYKKANYLQPGQYIGVDIEDGKYRWTI